MRKTLIALAAATGFVGLGTVGASAVTLGSAHASDQARPAETSMIQKADWYCGPRCEYWRHRRWEHRRWEEGHHSRDYGYNHYGYNNYGYHRGYYGSYR